MLMNMFAATNHANTSPAKIIRSQERSALNVEHDSLSVEAERLRKCQDFWHNWYLGLAAAAVILGIFSWAAMKFESNKTYALKPADSRLAAIDARLRALEDQDAAEDLQEAKSIAESAHETAKHEELEGARLGAQIAPRRLTFSQLKEIGRRCSGISGKRIIVRSYQLDPEAFVLGDQIASGLNATGFTVIPQLGFALSSGRPETGLQVRAPEEESRLCDCLVSAFRDVGHLVVTVNGPATDKTPLSELGISN